VKAIAFAQRLLPKLKAKDLASMDATAKLEMVTAINGGLQKLHTLAPHHSKIAPGSIFIAAPASLTLDLTEGSDDFTGYDVSEDDLYCTIRIDGDPVDNQIVGSGKLLHPFMGATGSHGAMLYHDAVIFPEPYAEIISRPRILETRRLLDYDPTRRCLDPAFSCKSVATPRYYWMEPNARNNNSPAPAVFRVDTLPDHAYRLQADMLLAPVRITVNDLLAAETEIPIREEWIESHLLPVVLGLLSTSDLWGNPATAGAALTAAATAEEGFAVFLHQTLATSNNRVGTPAGF
jgi:hypothetical protein